MSKYIKPKINPQKHLPFFEEIKNEHKENKKTIGSSPLINPTNPQPDKYQTTKIKIISNPKNKRIIIARELVIVLCSTLSILFYYLSLKGCYGDVSICASSRSFFFIISHKRNYIK